MLHMFAKLSLFVTIAFLGCTSRSTHHGAAEPLAGGQDTVAPVRPTMPLRATVDNKPTHLADTTFLHGANILFLMPDSARFEQLASEDEGVYEADGDFGSGVSATMDSMSHNKRYQNIHRGISHKRFVVILDADGGPKTVDRDTLNYGLLLTAKHKPMQLTNMIHSGTYLEEINDYFKLGGTR